MHKKFVEYFSIFNINNIAAIFLLSYITFVYIFYCKFQFHNYMIYNGSDNFNEYLFLVIYYYNV